MPRKVRFSERIGAVEVPANLQLASMSYELRVSLWNLLLRAMFSDDYRNWGRRLAVIYEGLLRLPVDDAPDRLAARDELKRIFFDKDFAWYKVYDLLEFIAARPLELLAHLERMNFERQTNAVLEEHLAGYRFIQGLLAPISSEQELRSIEESLRTAESRQLFGTAEHLRTALALISKRPDPDFRNSIKESISAVEALVKQVAGEHGGGLDKALGKLDAKIGLHPALKGALEKLYGYSCDEDGVRHAILEEPNVGFDEAKFMLVSCSAFVNFLAAKATSCGLLS